jgi:dolichyl-phosphate beta-glucosyltransferase
LKNALLIPCYNEEERLKCDQWISFIQKNSLLNFYFINDGSNDNTLFLLQKNFLEFENVCIIDYISNKGKGEALRTAILEIQFKNFDNYIFIDADLEIPLNQVITLIDFKKNNDKYTICLSNRINSSLPSNPKRYLGSRFINLLANNVIGFKNQINDTQCGCKLFSSSVIKIFEKPFISSWLFDIEIILRLKKRYMFDYEDLGIVNLIQVNTVEQKNNFPLKVLLKILKEFYVIYKTYKL